MACVQKPGNRYGRHRYGSGWHVAYLAHTGNVCIWETPDIHNSLRNWSPAHLTSRKFRATKFDCGACSFMNPFRTMNRENWRLVTDEPAQWSGRFLGITGWDPSVCKSNRLHVDILRFSFIKLGYILWIPLKWSVSFLQSWTSTGYFSNSTGSSVTNCRFSLIVEPANELRKKRLEFKTSGKLLIVLEESMEYTLELTIENWQITTCNRLDFGNSRILTDYAQKSPRTLFRDPRLLHYLLGAHPRRGWKGLLPWSLVKYDQEKKERTGNVG